MSTKIAAVILAAGGSSRLGQPKQLLEIAGEKLLHRAVRAAEEAGCSPVIVVVGANAVSVISELRDRSVDVVRNEDWACGIGTSIRAGIQRAIAHKPSVDAVILMTCDQPLLESDVLCDLIGKHGSMNEQLIASSYSNTLGIPALFGRDCFSDLLALRDNEGAKVLLLSTSRSVVAVPFPGGAIDIDTPEDLAAFVGQTAN